MPLPDVRGRTQILQHYMKDVVTSPEADVTILARGTAGFSGADLQNMVKCVTPCLPLLPLLIFPWFTADAPFLQSSSSRSVEAGLPRDPLAAF